MCCHIKACQVSRYVILIYMIHNYPLTEETLYPTILVYIYICCASISRWLEYLVVYYKFMLL